MFSFSVINCSMSKKELRKKLQKEILLRQTVQETKMKTNKTVSEIRINLGFLQCGMCEKTWIARLAFAGCSGSGVIWSGVSSWLRLL